ncbi:MAG: Dyp-type peroxidase, partial [Pseudomonadota bacterium]
MKPGFIPFRQTVSYASRLRRFLRLISVLRVTGVEGVERGDYVGPIDRLRTLHYVRWTLFDDDRRMLLAVNFDHPIEPYLRFIFDETGPLLDTILCHCEGYEESSTDLGYSGFLKFAQKYQIDVDSFSATTPHLTVDDYNYLESIERMQREATDLAAFDLAAARFKIPTPGEQVHAARTDPARRDAYHLQSLRLLRAAHYTSRFFPDPKPGDGEGAKDHLFYRRFAMSLIEGFDPSEIAPEIKAPFTPALLWAGFDPAGATPSRPAPRLAAMSEPTSEAPVHRSNVQGGVLDMYRTSCGERMNIGALALLRFDSRAAAGRFLANISEQVSTADDGDRDDLRVNFALSHEGLKTLGLDEATRLGFPAVFREGMAARCGMIGDIGPNHPEAWRPRMIDDSGADIGPLDLDTVDAVVQIQRRVDEISPVAHNWGPAHPLYDDMQRLIGLGVRILTVERLVRYEEEDGSVRGHFGFADGISQPVVCGPASRDHVPVSALLRGYDPTVEKHAPAILKDGTFLVARKLSMHVKAFNTFGGDLSAAERQDVQTRIFGRTQDGVPLAAPDTGVWQENNFDYKDDPDGDKCPMSSHVRRVNPRLYAGVDPVTGEEIHDDTPRIMRRSYSYGPRGDDDADRGLMFMCYNASIAEQFEVIQRWVGGGNSTRILSAQNDPLLGPPPERGTRTFRYVDNDVVKRVDLGRAPFVGVEWGLYFFAPSIEATGELAKIALNGAAVDDQAALVSEGERLIASFSSLDDWKQVLEDTDENNREKAKAVWEAIAVNHGGVFHVDGLTGEGKEAKSFTLVSDPEEVMRIFRDHKTFSVRTYWSRMRDTVGGIFLGMDPEPQPLSKQLSGPDNEWHRAFEAETKGEYLRTSSPVNPFLGAFRDEQTRRRTFLKVFEDVKAGIQDRIGKERDPATGGSRRLVDMEELIGASVSRFGLPWLGLGDAGITTYPHLIDGRPNTDRPKSPNDFLETATYLFGPWPKPDTARRAEERGQGLLSHVRAFIASRWEDPPLASMDPPIDSLFSHLRKRTDFDAQQIALLVVGSGLGLHSPTSSSFTGVAFDWIAEKTYWRHQQDF